jgi:LacI family transcriptional regulator
MAEAEPAAPSRVNVRRPPATIYDVAKATGVSPSTVSRALNKPGRLKAATEQRIRDAAQELGYRINPMARALPTGKTGTLALLVSDITNPVYFDLVRGAERVATANGLTLIFAESQESPELEFATAQRLQTSASTTNASSNSQR